MTHQTYQPDERAGIWIDHKTAFLIKVSADHSPIVEKLDIGIQHNNPGETHLRMEHSVFNKHDKLRQHQEHELKAFFKQLIPRLREIDFVYLTGPGETKHLLNRAIAKEGAHFPCKVVGIEAADKMTQNQMQQLVREFFTSLKYQDTVRQFSEGSGLPAN